MALPLTNLTGHYDASVSTKLWKTFVSGGPHTGTPVDGDSVAVWDHQEGANLIFKAGSSPVWRAATPLLPLPCLDFTTNTQLQLTNNANGTLALSAFDLSSACTVLVAFYAESITSSVDTYLAHPLLTDGLGYWGLILSLSGGVPTLLAYNYDGSQDYVRVPVTVGAAHVAMLRHEGGVLYASLDGGAESSLASGNTGNLLGPVYLGKTASSASLDARIGEVAVYNVALTGTVLTDAIGYFTARWLPLADTTAPVLSNPYPALNAVLIPGIKISALQITSNEAATVRYSTAPGTPYTSMPNVFSTTGGTLHQTNVGGLVDGGSYTYYLRASDAAGNATPSDYLIAFSVDAFPVLSNGLPAGMLATGTTAITLQVTTSEPATVKYATTPGVTYGAMPNTFATTGGTLHTTLVTGLTNGQSYTYYVRALDAQFNSTTEDFLITFSVAAAVGSVVESFDLTTMLVSYFRNVSSRQNSDLTTAWVKAMPTVRQTPGGAADLNTAHYLYLKSLP